MKILSPVDRIDEVSKVIDAGADELYCGVLTAEWHNRYIAGAISRRPGGLANFASFDQLKTCTAIAHAKQVPVYLTINEHYYIQDQYPFLIDFVYQATDAGVDGLILADLALLLMIRGMRVSVPIIISTGGNSFNSETVAFYRDLGASRVILPRHLTISEIADIRQHVEDIELEVFILNSRCPNVDGLCTFHHGLADNSFPLLYKNACSLPYHIWLGPDSRGDATDICWERQHIWETVHIDDYPCGACALYEFNDMNITSVKIVGRGNLTPRKVVDVRFLRSLLEALKSDQPDIGLFRKGARDLYRKLYDRSCRVHMCYYPEVLVG